MRQTDLEFATAYWHWFFLLQPGGLPERMIGADPEWFVREILSRWSAERSISARSRLSS